MANLFYGVSTSIEGDKVKQVIIYNPLEELVNPGDIIAVYFSNGNTVVAPSLNISRTNLSTGEDEIESLSSDQGELIKTRNTIDKVDYMWQAGEVCLFALTSQQFNSDLTQNYNGSTPAASNDALYYELIRGSRANSQYYGLTKLFTGSFYGPTHDTDAWNSVGFYNWLIGQGSEEDKTTAATPYLVRKLAEFLIGKINGATPIPGPDSLLPPPEEMGQQISYSPAEIIDEGAIEIGTLTVGNIQYEIKIPPMEGLEHTSQLFNDADIYLDGSIYKRNRNEESYAYAYQLSIDTVAQDDKTYYEKDLDIDSYTEVTPEITPQIITDPSTIVNPQEQGLWEILTPGYYLTTDTSFVGDNTYFVRVEDEEEQVSMEEIIVPDFFYPPYERPVPQGEDVDEQFNLTPVELNLYEKANGTQVPGVFRLTDDDIWVDNKTYYTQSDMSACNPNELGWYEYHNFNQYKETQDTEPVQDKPYFNPVKDNPSLRGWYERTSSSTPEIGSYFISNINPTLYVYSPNTVGGLCVVKPVQDQSSGGELHSAVEGFLLKKNLLIRDETKSNGISRNRTLLNSGFSTDKLNIFGTPINFCSKGNTKDITFTLGKTVNESKLTLKAPEFKENGESLVNRYAHHQVVKFMRLGAQDNWSLWGSTGEKNAWIRKKGSGKCIQVAAKKITPEINQVIEIPGYKPIGIVGYNITYAFSGSGYAHSKSNSSDATYQNLWEAYIHDVKIVTKNGQKYGQAVLTHRTRNLADRTTYFFIDFRVLCEKII